MRRLAPSPGTWARGKARRRGKSWYGAPEGGHRMKLWTWLRALLHRPAQPAPVVDHVPFQHSAFAKELERE